MNISTLFHTAATKNPDKIAIVDSTSSITYRDLQTGVFQTAAYFQKKGIQKGDRVLVFVPMSVDLYRIVLALFHCGATAVFLDEWVNKKRLELCCEIAQCRGFIGIPKARFFALFSKELRRIPIKMHPKKRLNTSAEIIAVDSEDSALITFTTGSTGRPKAADRTHGFLKEQFDALLDEIDPHIDDVDMPVLPIVLFMNLGTGCTSVIADFTMSKPETMDVGKIARQIEQYKVNRITASPFFITELAKQHTLHGGTYGQLEKIFTGGAPVFPATAKLYKQAFPNTQVNIVYGSTEAEPISSIEANDLVGKTHELDKGLPVGYPYHKAQVRILELIWDAVPEMSAEEFSSKTHGDETIGEIIVAGPHVLKRYYNNDAAFRKNKIVVNGTIWHRTGDSGFLRDGELFLTGRCEQLIFRNNSYHSIFLIENTLAQIEGVEIGTLIETGGHFYLVVEGVADEMYVHSKIDVSIPFDTIRMMNIPRDPRHNSKIDYAALEKMLHA